MSAAPALAPEVLEALRCPATQQPLVRRGTGWTTSDGDRTYSDVGGVASLVDVDLSLFSPSDAPPPRTSVTRRAADRVLPSSSLNVVSAGNVDRLRSMLRHAVVGRRAVVLVVGGGRLGAGMHVLVDDPDISLVETDVYVGDRTALLCDAHHLPFAAGTFDAVVVQAVLEHVSDPPRVAAEIARVLRRGGLLYSEIPFMQQVHEGPYDFTRYTELGHRRLFRHFEEVDRGVVNGPAMALVWAIRYFARSLPRRRGPAVSVLDRLATLLTGWIRHLDRFLLDHDGASDAASGTWFLGRLADHPVTDAEVVAGYRGAIPSPSR